MLVETLGSCKRNCRDQPLGEIGWYRQSMGWLLHVIFLFEINHDNGTVTGILSHLNTKGNGLTTGISSIYRHKWHKGRQCIINY